MKEKRRKTRQKSRPRRENDDSGFMHDCRVRRNFLSFFRSASLLSSSFLFIASSSCFSILFPLFPLNERCGVLSQVSAGEDWPL